MIPEEIITTVIDTITRADAITGSDVSGAQAVVNRAPWILRPAVVQKRGSGNVDVIFDGDGLAGEQATVLPVVSLVGYVYTNERVMVLVTGSSGNFIISRPSIPLAPGTVVAKIRRTITDTIGNNTAVPFDTQDYIPFGGHTVNGTRFTPPFAGRWVIGGVGRHQAIANENAVSVSLARNGVGAGIVTTSTNMSPSAGTGLFVSDTFEMNGSTDYVEMFIGNNIGSAVNCSGSFLFAVYGGPSY